MKLTKRWQVNAWHDYQPFFDGALGRWNWIDFTIIRLGFEWANYVPRFEFGMALLGFHFEVTYWRGDQPERWGDAPQTETELH